ncbi:MAG: hypothetical protein Kow0027_14930 [Saprospiraceae bacterium]
MVVPSAASCTCTEPGTTVRLSSTCGTDNTGSTLLRKEESCPNAISGNAQSKMVDKILPIRLCPL